MSENEKFEFSLLINLDLKSFSRCMFFCLGWSSHVVGLVALS
jgi:hypothetical protein